MTVLSGRRILVVLLASLFVASLIPIRSTVVPEWEIQFVDENANTISGVHVEEVCQHYTYTERNLCAEYPDSKQISDVNGKVKFSAKSISLSMASRIFRATYHYLTLIAHGSVGIDAYLVVSAPIRYESGGLINYRQGEAPPSKFVLRFRDVETH